MSEIRVKSTGTIKLFESDNTSHVTIASPASLSANRTITIPDADVTLGAGVSLSGSTNNTVATVTGANALIGEANLTFDGNEMTVQGTPVVVGTNSSSVLDLKNTNSSADGRAVGIAFSTNTGGSANAHITAVQDANAKGTLNFGGYDGTSTRNIVMSVDAGNSIVKVTGSDGTSSLSANTTYDDIVIDNDGSSGISFLGSTDANQQIRFDDSGGNRGVISYSQTNDYLTFGVGGGDKYRIKSGNDNQFFTFDSTQTTEAYYTMYIMSDKAEGNSNNRMIGFDNSSQGRGYIVAGDGDSDAPSFAAGSDRRLKENITNYTGGYDKIKSIPVKQWDEKYSSKKKGKIGWIADELDDVFPNAVSGTPNATKDVVNSVLDKDGRLVLEDTTKEEFDVKKSKGKYSNCTFHETATVPEYQYSSPLRFYGDVVQALQKAIEKIETLETENTDIKARLTALENA